MARRTSRHNVAKAPPDGYTFLHGVGLCWHKGKLYASIGHNKGEENTVTEEAQYRVSEDGGKTWGELSAIDAGEEKDLAVASRALASHPRIAARARELGFGHVFEALPTAAAVCASVAPVWAVATTSANRPSTRCWWRWTALRPTSV